MLSTRTLCKIRLGALIFFRTPLVVLLLIPPIYSVRKISKKFIVSRKLDSVSFDRSFEHHVGDNKFLLRFTPDLRKNSLEEERVFRLLPYHHSREDFRLAGYLESHAAQAR
ncbi:hypothetical protein TNCV_1111611 [Trichonephila clavipes]|nr:hypothetical protein TNCV_1111611 [Trichonephila clavipes]